METKKEKKGFWASLFSPKPCSCSCGDSLIVEENDEIAMEWFEKAAENGNEKALKITGRRRK